MKVTQYLTTEECAFEPDSAEIRCDDCGKPTGATGTCNEFDICAECREKYRNADVSDAEISARIISGIEGVGYNAKYRSRRVLHFSVDGKPACAARGGPHPMTTNVNEANCKRCVAARKG